MKDEKERWIEDVFESLEGSKRATPPPHLFSKIEQNLGDPGAKIISMSRFRVAAAAAATLLIVNISALLQYNENSASASPELVTDNSEYLISDYNLYDL